MGNANQAIVMACKRFKSSAHVNREYLWRELELGLTSQKFVRFVFRIPTQACAHSVISGHLIVVLLFRASVCSHASREARQKALLSMLVHFDHVETEMVLVHGNDARGRKACQNIEPGCALTISRADPRRSRVRPAAHVC